jgi:hypothetical protein
MRKIEGSELENEIVPGSMSRAEFMWWIDQYSEHLPGYNEYTNKNNDKWSFPCFADGDVLGAFEAYFKIDDGRNQTIKDFNIFKAEMFKVFLNFRNFLREFILSSEKNGAGNDIQEAEKLAIKYNLNSSNFLALEDWWKSFINEAEKWMFDEIKEEELGYTKSDLSDHLRKLAKAEILYKDKIVKILGEDFTWKTLTTDTDLRKRVETALFEIFTNERKEDLEKNPNLAVKELEWWLTPVDDHKFETLTQEQIYGEEVFAPLGETFQKIKNSVEADLLK